MQNVQQWAVAEAKRVPRGTGWVTWVRVRGLVKGEDVNPFRQRLCRSLMSLLIAVSGGDEVCPCLTVHFIQTWARSFFPEICI